MTSPQQVGSAYISITPKLDRSGVAAFREKLKREMKGLDTNTVAKVQAKVDTTGAERQVQKFRKSVDNSFSKKGSKRLETALYSFTSFRNLAQLGLLVSGVMAGTKVAIAAVAPALVALGSSAGFASVSLTALGPAMIGTGIAAWGVSQAFSEIGEKLKMHKKAAGGSKTAQEELAKALAKMKPAEREFFKTMLKLIKNNEKFRDSMKAAVLPGFTNFLEDLQAKSKKGKSALDLFQGSARGFGKTIGGTVAKLGDFIKSPAFKSDFKFMDKNNQAAFVNLGQAINKLIPPIFRLFAMSSPLVLRFSVYIEKLANQFSNWLDSFSDQQIIGFFQRAGTELAKWWTLASNLGKILFNVLGASLPSGGTLVDRLIAFTEAVKNYTGSEAGQKQIAKFFTFFANLDYGKMVKVVTQAIALAGVFKGVSLVAKHPILMFLAALAVQYPAETAEIINSISKSLKGAMEFAAKNPEAVTALLALIAAYKGLTVLRGLKLPVLGKGIPATGGKQAAGGALAGGVLGGPAGLAITVGTLIASDFLLNDGKGTKSLMEKIKDYFPKAYDSTLKNKEKSPTGFAEGDWITAFGKKIGDMYVNAGKGANKDQPNMLGEAFAAAVFPPTTLAILDKLGFGKNPPKAPPKPPALPVTGANVLLARQAAAAQAALNGAIAEGTLNLQANSEKSADNNVGLQNYVKANKDSIMASYEHIKATQGNAAAQKFLSAQNGTARRSLVDMLVQVGWNKKAAEKYAASVYAIPKTAPTDVELKKDRDAKERLRVLKGKIAEVAKLHTITVGIDDKKKVEERLHKLGIQQHALATGKTPSKAAADYKKYLGDKYHTGGKVRGHSPNKTADNIPAWLTANEYVQPVDSVRHYGVGFMDAIRNRTLPKDYISQYASGGRVLPYPVNINNTKIPKPADIVGGPGIGGGFGKWPSGPGAQRGDSGVWRKIIAIIKKIPGQKGHASSTYRAGDPLWHGSGRAVDWAGYNQDNVAGYFQKHKSKVLELIHRTNKRDYGVSRGQNSPMGNSLLNAHRNHVHIAMAQGGLVPDRLHDNGGPLLSGEGTNRSGQSELVLNNAQAHALEDRIRGGEGLNGDVQVNLYVDGELVRGVARAEIKKSNGELVNTLGRKRS